MIGGFYVEEVILLDSFQEPFGEGPDGMVRRGRGEGIIWCSDCRGLEVGMRCRVGEGVGRAVGWGGGHGVQEVPSSQPGIKEGGAVVVY